MEKEKYYLDYLKKTDCFPQSVYHKAKYAMVSRMFNLIAPGSKVLDAGCGIGNITGKYCEGYSIFGVDEQSEAIQYCQNTYSGKYIRADLYALPFEDNLFDLILFLDAIEHFDKPKLSLKELSRVLKPKASILICTMDYNSPLWLILEHTWHRFFGGTCKPYSKNVHPTQYTEKLLRQHCNIYFKEISLQKRMINMELFYTGQKASEKEHG